jgi:hypothetical protein
MTKVFVFDPDEERLRLLARAISDHSPEYNVTPRKINPANTPEPEGAIREVSTGQYDLIVGYTYGSPLAKDFINAYKRNNQSGRVIIYKTEPKISVADFKEYRFANDIIQLETEHSNASDRRNILTAIEVAMHQEAGIFYYPPQHLSGKSPSETTVRELIDFLSRLRMKDALGLIGGVIASIIGIATIGFYVGQWAQ